MDFYINLGSNPQEAVSRYVSLIGKPALPPFWSLGFQLSRYGFNNLKTMKKVYNRMKENAIPLGLILKMNFQFLFINFKLITFN